MTLPNDLVQRLLASIEADEAAASPLDDQRWSVPGPWKLQRVIRRCAADREIVRRCTEVIGDRDLSTYGEFACLKDDPNSLAVTLAAETLYQLAKGYSVIDEIIAEMPRTGRKSGVVYQTDDTAIVVLDGADDDAAIIDAADAVTPFKDGCPNTPNCGHAGFIHDVYDEEDRMPMCGFIGGCMCGKPPAGWERTNQYWKRGDTIPAGVYVQALDGTVHQAAEAWENADFEWLVEIEEIGSAR